jgi:hypothetical protein
MASRSVVQPAKTTVVALGPMPAPKTLTKAVRVPRKVRTGKVQPTRASCECRWFRLAVLCIPCAQAWKSFSPVVGGVRDCLRDNPPEMQRGRTPGVGACGRGGKLSLHPQPPHGILPACLLYYGVSRCSRSGIRCGAVCHMRSQFLAESHIRRNAWARPRVCWAGAGRCQALGRRAR